MDPHRDIDIGTARQLCALTKRFYERASASFSATRQAPWPGWQHVWKMTDQQLGPFDDAHPLEVLDVGCGNLRFERFLADQLGSAYRAWAIDDCEALMAEGRPDAATTTLRKLDVAGALADGAGPTGLAAAFEAPPCSVAVAFGLLHHVPRLEWRVALLRAMAEALRPGGLLAVSLWQFADDPRLRPKAADATERGCCQLGLPPLPPDDFLMGWQGDASAFRYCHHFAEEEADQLSAALAHEACEVARFSADGRTGSLNRYLIWQRR